VTSGQTFTSCGKNTCVNSILGVKTIDWREAIHSFVAVYFFSASAGLMNEAVKIGGWQASGI
jgi:hypothetical protein